MRFLQGARTWVGESRLMSISQTRLPNLGQTPIFNIIVLILATSYNRNSHLKLCNVLESWSAWHNSYQRRHWWKISEFFYFPLDLDIEPSSSPIIISTMRPVSRIVKMMCSMKKWALLGQSESQILKRKVTSFASLIAKGSLEGVQWWEQEYGFCW